MTALFFFRVCLFLFCPLVRRVPESSHLQAPSLTLPSLSRLSRSHLGASQGRALFALSEAWLSVSLSPLPWHVGAEGEERGLLDGLQSSAHLKPV